MTSTHRKLAAVLAIAAFTLGAFLRYSSEDVYYRWWSAAAKADVKHQMAAYNSSGTSDVGVQSNVDLRPMESYYSVLRIIQDHYVEKIKDEDKKNLTYSSIKVMLNSLKDPNTRFYEPEQTQIIQQARAGTFHGIGAVLAVKQEKIANPAAEPDKNGKTGTTTFEKLVVVTTLPGSPASKAGLKSGDVITEVDGKSVLPYDPFTNVAKLIKSARNNEGDKVQIQKDLDKENNRIKNGINFQKAMDTLSAKENKEYTLTVLRSGQAKPLKIKVGSAETAVDPVSQAIIDGNIGYIHLRLIGSNTSDDFAMAMQEIQSSGAKSLILDMRDCVGNSTDSVKAIASWFAPNRTLAKLMGARGKQQTVKIPALQVPQGVKAGHWRGRTIILTDEGTSGEAEVLAAALRDNKIASIVGEKTYGDALQQTMYVLKDNSAISVTTGKYLSPLGKDFNVKGLVPDVRVSDKTEDKTDEQLDRAIEMAKAH
jgi:carboxyl-terminal processing protease